MNIPNGGKAMRTKNKLAIFCLFLSIIGCSRGANQGANALQVKGSDTMVNLCQAWAEAFMQKKPSAAIAVTGGGSGTGIAALINGSCRIASSSRQMAQEEIELAKGQGVTPLEHAVALDGLAVIVHPSNPVSKLTLDQLADIFTGKIKNWKEVGGKDEGIVVLSREVNSGTHVYFKEHVLRHGHAKGPEEFSPEALLLASSQAIADEVAQNPKTIGYFGIGYISPAQKVLALSKSPKGPFLAPSVETVKKGTYTISRPLYFYTNGTPEGIVKEFLDFVDSPEAQKITEEQDFVPMK